ncbi:MAG: sigma factor-like helix-turn-helix DNA-binding protein [Nocardioides sp.]
MSDEEDFHAVRHESDPVRRARRATELLTKYQQRAAELARLRREAIESAHRERGMSYTEIAAELGITKGRVTQIRTRAPQPERAFFGTGPITVGTPYRYHVADREQPVIAAEDADAADHLERLLSGLGFSLNRFRIEPDLGDLPDSDAVVICGPKSAPVATRLIGQDPALRVIEADGLWWIRETQSGKRHGSPSDQSPPEQSDLAYVARHHGRRQTIVHIAGLHAIGSLGAAHYLAQQVGSLFREAGEHSMSCVVRSHHDGLEITGSELMAGPFVW